MSYTKFTTKQKENFVCAFNYHLHNLNPNGDCILWNKIILFNQISQQQMSKFRTVWGTHWVYSNWVIQSWGLVKTAKITLIGRSQRRRIRTLLYHFESKSSNPLLPSQFYKRNKNPKSNSMAAHFNSNPYNLHPNEDCII